MTDTIYGVLASALNQKAVSRVYKLRRRRPDKPFIVLIGKFSDLEFFGIKLSSKSKRILKNLWPGKVSVILRCLSEKFKYLHRGTKTLAFRLPKKKNLREFLRKTGPLAAPSANPEGKPPAKSIEEARKYFGHKVWYVEGGRPDTLPSTLVSLEKGRLKVLRQGAAKIPKK